MVTMEDKLEIMYGLSYGMIASDLEWVWVSLLPFETFVILITHKDSAIQLLYVYT